MGSKVISPYHHTKSHHFCVPVILSMLTNQPGLTLLTLTLLSITELGYEKEVGSFYRLFLIVKKYISTRIVEK